MNNRIIKFNNEETGIKVYSFFITPEQTKAEAVTLGGQYFVQQIGDVRNVADILVWCTLEQADWLKEAWTGSEYIKVVYEGIKYTGIITDKNLKFKLILKSHKARRLYELSFKMHISGKEEIT